MISSSRLRSPLLPNMHRLSRGSGILHGLMGLEVRGEEFGNLVEGLGIGMLEGVGGWG